MDRTGFSNVYVKPAPILIMRVEPNGDIVVPVTKEQIAEDMSYHSSECHVIALMMLRIEALEKKVAELSE